MAFELFSPQDVEDKLHQTICLWDGEPYFIHVRPGSKEVTLLEMDGKARTTFKVVNPADDSFSWSDIRLGYYQDKTEAKYVERSARRMFKNGLSPEAITHLDVDYEPGEYWFGGKRMKDCIKGRHMPFRDALELVSSGAVKSAAFHRHFAVKSVRGAIFLEFRGSDIGVYSKSTKAFTIYEVSGASFRNRLLKQAGVPL